MVFNFLQLPKIVKIVKHMSFEIQVLKYVIKSILYIWHSIQSVINTIVSIIILNQILNLK
jgi:hypothetical protein